MQEQPVTIMTIAGGAVIELFDRELEKIAADILDLNSKATAKRTITITVEIEPEEDRGKAEVSVTVASKLGTPKAVGTLIFLGKREGKPIAVENITAQKPLFDQLGPRPVVIMQTGEVKDADQR